MVNLFNVKAMPDEKKKKATTWLKKSLNTVAEKQSQAFI